MHAGLACLPAWAVFATAALSRASARQFVSLSCAMPLRRLTSINMHLRGVVHEQLSSCCCDSFCYRTPVPARWPAHPLLANLFQYVHGVLTHSANSLPLQVSRGAG